MRRNPEISGEIVNRPDITEPSRPTTRSECCLCDVCRQGFYVEAPVYATRERLNAHLNKAYPDCPGHPINETVEIFPHELPPLKSPGVNAVGGNFRQRRAQQYSAKTVAEKAAERERFLAKAEEVEKLYGMGLSYQKIAEELGYRGANSVGHLRRRLKQMVNP